MKEKRFVLFGMFILLLGTVSAYSYSSSWFGEVFNQIGEENLFLAGVFLVSLVLVMLSLKRSGFFDEYPTGRTVIAVVFALGITYLGFYKTGIGFDFSGFFSGFGFSTMVVDLLIFLLVAAVVIFLGLFALRKFGINSLFVFGGLFIALSMMGETSIDSTLLIVGIVMISIWLLIHALKLAGLRAIHGTNVRVNVPRK